MTDKPQLPTARSIVWLIIKVVFLLLAIGLGISVLITLLGLASYRLT